MVKNSPPSPERPVMSETQDVSPESRRPRRRALLAGVAALSLALAACGGSDDAEPADEPAEADAATTEVDAAPTEGADADTGSGADAQTDATGDDGQTLGDAMDSMTPEVRMGVVADVLGENVGLDIDGTDIRLTLNEGTVDFDAVTDCIGALSLAVEGETITLIYPDGEYTC